MGVECSCVRSDDDNEIHIGHGVYGFKKAVRYSNILIC